MLRSRFTPGDVTGASDRQYRRGAVMGLTMAEVFVLIAFMLLLLLSAWKVQTDRANARFDPVEELSREQLATAAEMAEAKQIEPLGKLVAAGAEYRELARKAEAPDRWRFIDSDELRRIVDSVERMPEDMQRDIADLVEIKNPKSLVEILERTERAPEKRDLQRRLARIGQRLSTAQEAERAMVKDLRQSLGGVVSEIGGHIDSDGAIVLPDTVLFEVGQSRITPRMRRFLDAACVPWMRVMMRSPAPVAGARIEGHASSEWRPGTPVDQAYLNNLGLSQGRSQAVLRACLRHMDDPGIQDWARKHLVAVGYSSAHPVIEDGVENRDKSRRVVFSVEFDNQKLLEGVEREVGDGLVDNAGQ